MIIQDIIRKISILTTIGLGTIMVIGPISRYVGAITTDLGQFIIGVILIGIGIYLTKNHIIEDVKL